MRLAVSETKLMKFVYYIFRLRGRGLMASLTPNPVNRGKFGLR